MSDTQYMYMYKAAMKHSYIKTCPKALHSTPWQHYTFTRHEWSIRLAPFLTGKTSRWTAQEQKRTSLRTTLTLIPVTLRPRHCLVPGQPENFTSLLILIIWCQPQRSVIFHRRHAQTFFLQGRSCDIRWLHHLDLVRMMLCITPSLFLIVCIASPSFSPYIPQHSIVSLLLLIALNQFFDYQFLMSHWQWGLWIFSSLL